MDKTYINNDISQPWRQGRIRLSITTDVKNGIEFNQKQFNNIFKKLLKIIKKEVK